MPIKWQKQKFCSHICYWKSRKGKRVSKGTEFKNGVIPWNKGKHIQLNDALIEWIKQGGSSMRGRKFSEEHKRKIREKRKFQKNPSGKNHWNWKGGKREEILDEYRKKVTVCKD